MIDGVIIIHKDEVNYVKDGCVRDIYGRSWRFNSVKSAAFSPDGNEIVLVVTF